MAFALYDRDTKAVSTRLEQLAPQIKKCLQRGCKKKGTYDGHCLAHFDKTRTRPRALKCFKTWTAGECLEKTRAMLERVGPMVAEADKILIEKQPRQGGKTNLVAHILFTLLSLECPNVHFILASRKYRHLDGDWSTYDQRKRSSIAYIETTFPSELDQYTKKDDVADAILLSLI